MENTGEGKRTAKVVKKGLLILTGLKVATYLSYLSMYVCMYVCVYVCIFRDREREERRERNFDLLFHLFYVFTG